MALEPRGMALRATFVASLVAFYGLVDGNSASVCIVSGTEVVCCLAPAVAVGTGLYIWTLLGAGVPLPSVVTFNHSMHVGLLSGYLLQSPDHDCQKIADIVVMLFQSLAGASVILERFEMYRTHDLPLWAPQVYFQCQGEPKHKLTGVTQVHRRYNFTMHESFQVRECGEYAEEHYVAAEALE